MLKTNHFLSPTVDCDMIVCGDGSPFIKRYRCLRRSHVVKRKNVDQLFLSGDSRSLTSDVVASNRYATVCVLSSMLHEVSTALYNLFSK